MKKKKIMLFAMIFQFFLIGISNGQQRPFYEKKTIKLLVGANPGGGYDFYARLMARFMQKQLPGSTFVVKNVPGAGQIICVNQMYHSKPDGLTISTMNRGLGISQVVGVKGSKFDFKKLNFLGSAATEVYGLFVLSKKFKDLDDVIKAESLKLATSGLGSLDYVTSLLFSRMMGVNNLTLGTGYTGGETELAILRGEMDGCFATYVTRENLVKSGDVRVLLLIGKSKPPGCENVPFLQEIVRDEKYQPIIELLTGVNVVGRPFAGPPGIPADRLTILREAFRKALYDPELLEFTRKLNRPIDFISHVEVEKWAHALFELPPDVVKMLKEAYGVM